MFNNLFRVFLTFISELCNLLILTGKKTIYKASFIMKFPIVFVNLYTEAQRQAHPAANEIHAMSLKRMRGSVWFLRNAF